MRMSATPAEERQSSRYGVNRLTVLQTLTDVEMSGPVPCR
jgi:hypothetical protein